MLMIGKGCGFQTPDFREIKVISFAKRLVLFKGTVYMTVLSNDPNSHIKAM